MRRNKWVYLGILALSLVMVMGFATVAMATGAVADPEPAVPEWGNWYVMGWSAVNFFVLLALLYKFGFNPINNMLEERTNTIESSIKHAEEVRVEVDQMQKEAQANLAESRKEAQEIVARANRTAEEMKTDIINKANEEVSTMKERALSEIDAATEAARVELRDTAVTLAIMAAERVLERAITEEDHKKMVREFVNEAGDYLC